MQESSAIATLPSALDRTLSRLAESACCNQVQVLTTVLSGYIRVRGSVVIQWLTVSLGRESTYNIITKFINFGSLP